MRRELLNKIQDLKIPMCRIHNNKQYLSICINPQCDFYLEPLCNLCIKQNQNHQNHLMLDLDEFFTSLAILVKLPKEEPNTSNNENQFNQANQSASKNSVHDNQGLHLESIYKKLTGIIEQCQLLQNELTQTIKFIKNAGNLDNQNQLIDDLENQVLDMIEQSQDAEYFATNLQKLKGKILIKNDKSIQINLPKGNDQEQQILKQIQLIKDKYNQILTNPNNQLTQVEVKNTQDQLLFKDNKPIEIESIKQPKENHKDRVWMVIQFQSPDSKFDKCLISCSRDKQIMIQDPNNLNCLEKFNFNDYICSILQVSQQQIAIGGGKEDGIQIWNLDNKSCSGKLIGHQDCIGDMKLVDNNQYLISCGADKQIILWNLQNYKMIKKFDQEHASYVFRILLLNENQFMTSSEDSTLKVWQIDKCQSLKTMKYESYPFSLAKLDENFILSGHDNGILVKWNLSTGQLVAQYKAHTKLISSILLLSSQMILTASWDKSLKILKYDDKFNVQEKFVSKNTQFAYGLYYATIISDNQLVVIEYDHMRVVKFK